MGESLAMDSLEVLRQAGDNARDAALEAIRHRLLGVPGAGTDLARLVAATADGAEPDEVALALLAGTLDAARMADENDQAGGRRFLDEVTAQVEALDRADALGNVGRLALASAFVGAGLPAPDALALVDEPEGATYPVLPDIEPLLEPLRDAAGGDAVGLHAQLKQLLATMPPGLRAALVAAVAGRDDPLFARVSAYFLLDADVAPRRAAAEGLLGRAEAGGLDATSAGRLAVLRPWLPADEAREVVDRALRAAAKRGAFGGATQPGWKLGRAFASLWDGAGATTLGVPAQSGRRRVIAMILLKQGFGVKDAYVLPCASVAEQRRTLDHIGAELDTLPVGTEFVAEALEIALAEGLAAGLPPAPGLLDVVEVLGIAELRPQARTVADIVAGLGVAGWTKRRTTAATRRSATWLDDYDVIRNWFEDGGEVRAILAAHEDDREAEAALRAFLETRRGWWSRLCALSALTLEAAGDPGFEEFAAVAHRIEAGAPLADIPIFDSIVEGTILMGRGTAPREAMLDAGPELAAPDPEKPGELAKILAESELTPEGIDGFVMAVVVAPKVISPGELMTELVDRVPPARGMEALQRFLDLVVGRLNSAAVDSEDAARLGARIAALGPDELRLWAEGFSHLVQRFPASWRHKSVRKDDKAMLSLIDAVGEGADAAELRPMLPGWLARRALMR
jgi:hypothetical protein